MEAGDKVVEFRRRFDQITKSDLLVDQANLREQLIRPLVPLFLLLRVLKRFCRNKIVDFDLEYNIV